MYAPGEYDLAGFAVGVVERSKILNGARVARGDVVIGVASSGLHSNGYSLARRVLNDEMKLPMDREIPELGMSVGAALLVPTRIYAKAVSALLSEAGVGVGVGVGEGVRGLSHITGGGLPGNVPRALPEGLGVRLDLATYKRPAIFDVIARGGPVEEAEMRRTFNLGVGLVAIVAPEVADRAVKALQGAGETAWIFGEVIDAAEVAFEERVQFA
jgi:phosphoribosylformylglycinamidine cyclo-ligase